MQKLKTNKAIRSRFKVTKTKKVMSSRTKRRHLLGDRSASKKRQARKRWTMGKIDRKAVLRALPYA
ncbi:MAG: 50S ribosomal protein L35 [Omnitrophica bacterium RIFCSPHIGHO2_02_FULL_46_11]|nr:MAG: 50S ribosomal protein L35 [Omnitrophica bacterium RIFCSPHIGHO2_02_FULL_46_11]OGW85343.1 MAG: 50S ribosomal protein L35 [Omnitrophica bacterium RIFCSPLOWO2_01_FULL_45_10b]